MGKTCLLGTSLGHLTPPTTEAVRLPLRATDRMSPLAARVRKHQHLFLLHGTTPVPVYSASGSRNIYTQVQQPAWKVGSRKKREEEYRQKVARGQG